MRIGLGLSAPKPVRLGTDFARVVEAVGRRVAQFKLGDEVFGVARGAIAEYLEGSHARGKVIINFNF